MNPKQAFSLLEVLIALCLVSGISLALLQQQFNSVPFMQTTRSAIEKAIVENNTFEYLFSHT